MELEQQKVGKPGCSNGAEENKRLGRSICEDFHKTLLDVFSIKKTRDVNMGYPGPFRPCPFRLVLQLTEVCQKFDFLQKTSIEVFCKFSRSLLIRKKSV
ncbi:hypothetical protein YC2023_043043 [Brassica napus]